VIKPIGEDVAQPRTEVPDGGQDIDGPVAILNIGGLNHKADQLALSIGDDVALAALDLRACVIPGWTAALGGLDRLTVDDTRRRTRLAPGLFTGGHHQNVVDLGERAVPGPAIEVGLHRRIGRELPGELPPLTAGRSHVEHRFEHPAQVRPTRPADRRRRRQERRDQSPLAIRQIACIPQAVVPILPTSGLSPSHRDLH
jgi:hypothetical protein